MLDRLRRHTSTMAACFSGRSSWPNAAAGAFFYAGALAYTAGTPFAYISYCKLSEWVMGCASP